MAPSSFAKHRFQNSLDLAAARSLRNVGQNVQSGTGNAWCIVDSPTLGRMSSVSRRSEEKQPVASGSRLAVPADITAPLNVKKARRRGLVSGVHLVLPPSPLPLTSSNLAVPTPRTSSTPGTALTFTAEWDLTQKTFVFTPFESDTPSSAGTPMFILSPVPVNVDHADDDSLPRSPAPSTPSLYAPSRSSMQVLISPAPARVRRSWTEGLVVVTDAPAESRPSRLHDSSPASEPSTPVSPIFDSPPPPPKHAHARSASQSTAASSVTDLALPEAEQPPPASPKPTPADAARHTFAQELLRAVPAARDGGDFSPDTYRELDADLLLSPMDVFERTLWEGTVPDSRRATLQRPLAPPRRPPADVPRTASSAFSVYSLDPSSSPHGGGSPSSKGSLRQQISKALSSTLLFRR